MVETRSNSHKNTCKHSSNNHTSQNTAHTDYSNGTNGTKVNHKHLSAPTNTISNMFYSLNVTRGEAIDLFGSVAAINICYLIYAVLQERLTHKSSDTSVDQHMFIMLVQCIINAVIVVPFILYNNNTKQHRSNTDHIQSLSWKTRLQYACISLTYVGGMLTSYWSFDYISYPTAVLVKSCKMVPVMLIGSLAFGKRYTIREMICVIGLTVGIYGFMYYSSNKHSDESSSSLYGITLSGLSLLCDGLTGSQQDKAVAQYKPSSYQLMFNTNLYAVLELLLMTSITGELSSGLQLCINNPVMLQQLVIFGVVSGIGQLFIFHMITRFGALPLAITTSTRKLLTILCSTVVFGHMISMKQWACVGIVFTALLYDILGKAKSRKNKSQ